MKKYTLLEALNMLKQDHDLVFKIVPKKDPCTQTISSSVFEDVIVDCQGCQEQNECCSLQFSDIWTLEPRPVCFIEAVKSGKKIRYEKWGETEYFAVPVAFNILSGNTTEFIKNAVNSKWYIKEDEE